MRGRVNAALTNRDLPGARELLQEARGIEHAVMPSQEQTPQELLRRMAAWALKRETTTEKLLPDVDSLREMVVAGRKKMKIQELESVALSIEKKDADALLRFTLRKLKGFPIDEKDALVSIKETLAREKDLWSNLVEITRLRGQ
jgi:hypothetical protein